MNRKREIEHLKRRVRFKRRVRWIETDLQEKVHQTKQLYLLKSTPTIRSEVDELKGKMEAVLRLCKVKVKFIPAHKGRFEAEYQKDEERDQGE